MKILDLLQERTKYTITPDGDEWIRKALDEMEGETFVVVETRDLADVVEAQDEGRCFVAGVYELGQPYMKVEKEFLLCHLVKEKPEKVDFALYAGQVCTRTFRFVKSSDWATMPERYASRYREYLQSIEEWLETGICPGEMPALGMEYKSVRGEDMDEGNYLPQHYSNKSMEIRKMLEIEDMRSLGEMADVLAPRVKSDEFGLVIRVSDFHYPLQINELEEGQKSDVRLQKGDILLPNLGFNTKPYLVTDEPEVEIYANPRMFVLRAREGVTPEYLYLYLSSDVFQTIMETRACGSLIPRYTMKTVRDIPVVVPKLDAKDYIAQAYIITHEERTYSKTLAFNSRMLAYANGMRNMRTKKAGNVEDILSTELLNTLRVHSDNQLYELLQSDWNELNACFKAGAYKATLILAGSILEAVLIDWLSEIHGCNYFETEYKISDKNGNLRSANLVDYINAIKNIEKPHWMQEASMAHEIRKKRNLVHAKLGINSTEINEETCKMVIQYLEKVLETRMS